MALATAVAAVALTAGALTSCGAASPATQPRTGTANADSRNHIYAALRRTVRVLPPAATLSYASSAHRQPFGPALLNPCTDAPTANTHQVYATYWVNGADEKTATPDIVAAWRSWGWTEAWSRPRTVAYDDGSGYVFTVTDAANGPGGISISAVSPCFADPIDPATNDALNAEQPSVFTSRQ